MTDLAAIPDDCVGIEDLEQIERQHTLQVDHRTPDRRGRRNWGLPPNIARASVSREPPPPVAAPKPAPVIVQAVAPPPIHLPGRVLAVFSDYDGQRARRRDGKLATAGIVAAIAPVLPVALAVIGVQVPRAEYGSGQTCWPNSIALGVGNGLHNPFYNPEILITPAFGDLSFALEISTFDQPYQFNDAGFNLTV